MKKLSVAIITKNEERNIRRCLNSVKWVDEIIVVDSGSVDNTLLICEEFKCKVFKTDWLGFGKTKQLAVDNCSNDWVFVLDADEVISDALKNSIKKILISPQYDGYKIKRNSFYMDKMIKYCGWNNDFTLRLFNKNKGCFNDKLVHESIQIVSGKIGIIYDVIFHYTFPEIYNHITKMVEYSKLGATQKNDKKIKSSICKAVFRGLFKFIKMYFLQLGFLDGKYGFVLSINSAFGVYLKYLYVWEKTNELNS